MEKVTSSLAIQEVELVKLQVEVDQLLAGNTEHLALDPPEELIKARVENEKLKYGFKRCGKLVCANAPTKSAILFTRYQLNILKRAVEKELGENKGEMSMPFNSFAHLAD